MRCSFLRRLTSANLGLAFHRYVSLELACRWPCAVLKVFSKARMSSSVSLPASRKWANNGLGRTTKQIQEIIDQPAVGCLAGHAWFIDVCIPDLPNSTDGPLFFKPVHHGLNRGVSWPSLLR